MLNTYIGIWQGQIQEADHPSGTDVVDFAAWLALSGGDFVKPVGILTYVAVNIMGRIGIWELYLDTVTSNPKTITLEAKVVPQKFQKEFDDAKVVLEYQDSGNLNFTIQSSSRQGKGILTQR